MLPKQRHGNRLSVSHGRAIRRANPLPAQNPRTELHTTCSGKSPTEYTRVLEGTERLLELLDQVAPLGRGPRRRLVRRVLSRNAPGPISRCGHSGQRLTCVVDQCDDAGHERLAPQSTLGEVFEDSALQRGESPLQVRLKRLYVR